MGKSNEFKASTVELATKNGLEEMGLSAEEAEIEVLPTPPLPATVIILAFLSMYLPPNLRIIAVIHLRQYSNTRGMNMQDKQLQFLNFPYFWVFCRVHGASLFRQSQAVVKVC